jgi:putative ABC transport system substrate-binding protein
MRRRDFINLLGAAVMLCSSRARAQPSRTYSLGYLALAPVPYLVKALKDGLRKLGYIEDHNLKVEYRFLSAGGTSAALAAELVKHGPDVIIAVGTAMTIAAKRATTTIPIVMTPVADPLRAGIVTSLAHPGGNVTGTMLYVSGQSNLVRGLVPWPSTAMRAIAGTACLNTSTRLPPSSEPQ